MHCYTRFTQVKNRCIMGGKGRGVFSDFRLGRVGPSTDMSRHRTDTVAVPISNQRPRWKPPGCTEGELVDLRWEEGAVEHVLYYEAHIWHRAASSSRIHTDHDTLTYDLWINIWLVVTRRSCLNRLLLPLSVVQTWQPSATKTSPSNECNHRTCSQAPSHDKINSSGLSSAKVLTVLQ
jgi:hypothetical protein